MIPSSEPNNDDDNSIAPVLPTLSFDIPALPMHVDGDHGSTAQADPLTPSLPLPPPMAEISLTFLLISGKRRTMSFAASTTIGRVKELVWNSWPVEWSDEQPPAPNYLRILYLGKMLQDEDVLESMRNPLALGPGVAPGSRPASAVSPSPVATQPPSTIVHLSIRPVPQFGETDDFKKKKRRTGSTSSGAPGHQDDEEAGCCAGCVVC